jgi:very-short-patch-repair endonuclease
LLDEGTVTQPLRGVYVVGELSSDLASRASAVSLRLPPCAVLCRGTAAWLLGVDDVRGPGRPIGPAALEVLVPTGTTPLRRAGLRSYQAALPPQDVMSVRGLRCTTPARTAADLARWLPRPMGLAVLDAMAHTRRVDPRQVSRVLERFAGHSGAAVARELVDLVEPRTESYGESWLRLRVHDAGFPRPQAQVPIRDASGRVVYRLDLGLPERRVGFEYDGLEHHASAAAQAHDAARRFRLLEEFGWTVIGFHLGHVLGSSLLLERTVGELLGIAPAISRRSW